MRAIAIRSASYRTVKIILSQHMEQAPLFDEAQPQDQTDNLGTANVRGARYYN